MVSLWSDESSSPEGLTYDDEIHRLENFCVNIIKIFGIHLHKP